MKTLFKVVAPLALLFAVACSEATTLPEMAVKPSMTEEVAGCFHSVGGTACGEIGGDRMWINCPVHTANDHWYEDGHTMYYTDQHSVSWATSKCMLES